MRNTITLVAFGLLVSLPAHAETNLELAELPSQGHYLTDGSGRSLYIFSADKKGSGESACFDQCARAWPPVVTEGEPSLSGGLVESQVGHIKRKDGKVQMTYQGHPLYYFSMDKGSERASGHGKEGFGGKWLLLGGDGKPLTEGVKGP